MNIANLNNLGQFTGGDEYFTHPIGRMRYSEGVKFLAENADCWWLLDAIGSYQPQLLIVETFQYMQFWELVVNPNKSCVLVCRADSGVKPAVTQQIEWTDFPLPSITLWVEHGTLILPSEH